MEVDLIEVLVGEEVEGLLRAIGVEALSGCGKGEDEGSGKDKTEESHAASVSNVWDRNEARARMGAACRRQGW